MSDKYYSNRYGNVYGTMTALPIGRATFVHLAEPNAKYQPAKYGVHVLFPKNEEAVKKGLNTIIEMCKAIAEQKYGKKVPAFTYGPVRDGDEQKYQGFAGCWYIKASSKQRVEIVDTQRKGLDPALIVPGVKIRAVVTPILFDSGFSYQLNMVQFVADDGVRYYGGTDPKSLLSALDVDAAPEEPTASEAADKALGTVKAGKRMAIDML